MIRGTLDRLIRPVALALTVAILMTASPVNAQDESAIAYSIIDLGPLVHLDQASCPFDAPAATVYAIAAGNRAVGSVYHDGERAVAALFSPGSVRKMASGPGGGAALAVNRGGQIAGVIYERLPAEPCGLPSGAAPATWNSDFRRTELDLPERASEGAATAINDDGVIAGWVATEAGRRAAIWRDGELSVIADAEIDGIGDVASEAVAINDTGIVAGTIRWQEGDRERSRPFLWDGVNIDVLDPGPGRDGFAGAISDDGAVAGGVIDDEGITRTALWQGGEIITLDGLPDRPHAAATDMNNAGFVVGYGAREDGLTRAVIWIENTAVDLNAIIPENSGWLLQMAVGINDDGTIAGWGDFDGERRAFLLVPAAG